MLTGRRFGPEGTSMRKPKVGPPSWRSSIGSSCNPVHVRNGRSS